MPVNNDLNVPFFCLCVIELVCSFGGNLQEEVEEEADNDNNKDDSPDPLVGDIDEKHEQEQGEQAQKPKKTSKYMTKYERARILGTRALQIRFFYVYKYIVLLY